jgi:hypothetical protein
MLDACLKQASNSDIKHVLGVNRWLWTFVLCSILILAHVYVEIDINNILGLYMFPLSCRYAKEPPKYGVVSVEKLKNEKPCLLSSSGNQMTMC